MARNAREEDIQAPAIAATRIGDAGEVQYYGDIIDRINYFQSRMQRRAENRLAQDVDAESASLQADSYENLNRLASEHENDPAAFKAAAEGYVKGTIAGAYPRNREILGPALRTDIERQYRSLVKQQEARLDEQYLAKFQQGAETLIEKGGYLARAGDAAGIEQNRAQLVDLIDGATGRVVDGKPTSRRYFDETHAVRLLEQYDEHLAENAVRHRYEVAPNKEKFIASLSKQQVPHLDAQQRDRLVREFEADVARKLAEQREARAAQLREMKFQQDLVEEQIDDAVTVLNSGGNLPPERVAALRKDATAVGRTDWAMALSEAERDNASLNRIAKLPTNAQVAELRQFKPETADEVRYQHRLEQMVRTQTELRKRDPLVAAEQVGLVDRLPPLDPTDPKSWKARREAADRVASAWNLPPISPLTKDEADAFEQSLTGLTVNEQLATLSAAAHGMGNERMSDLARQIYEKNDAAPVAVAASLLANATPTRSNLSTARDVLEGAQVDPALRKVSGISTLDAARIVSEELGQTFEADPRAGSAVVGAVEQAYVARAAKKGAQSLDGELLRQTVRDVAGDIVTWNDSRILAPHGWTEANVADWLDQIDGPALDQMGGVMGFEGVGGSARAADLIAETGRLITVAPGEYLVEVEANDGPVLSRGYLLDPSGSPFLLRAPVEPPASAAWEVFKPLSGPSSAAARSVMSILGTSATEP